MFETELLLNALMNSRARQARRDATGARVLEYGRPFRAVFVTIAILWVAMAAWVAIDEPPEQGNLPAMLSVLAAFEAGTIALVLTFYRHSIRLTEHGIGRRSPWTRDIEVSWGQVQQVRYNRVTKEFVIETAAGRIRVARCLDGLAALRDEIARRVPLPCWSAAQDELDSAAR